MHRGSGLAAMCLYDFVAKIDKISMRRDSKLLVSERILEDRQMIRIFFKMFGADEVSIQAPLA